MATVFSYVLEDSWQNVILQVELTDEKRSNISCIYHMYDWKKKGTMKKSVINHIYRIIRENHHIFSYKDTEFLVLLDGFVQIFQFFDGENSHTIKGLNLNYLALHPERLEECERARNLLNVFYQIRDVLLENGALPECFQLECKWSPYVDDYYESDYFKFYPDDFFLQPSFMYGLPSD